MDKKTRIQNFINFLIGNIIGIMVLAFVLTKNLTFVIGISVMLIFLYTYNYNQDKEVKRKDGFQEKEKRKGRSSRASR